MWISEGQAFLCVSRSCRSWNQMKAEIQRHSGSEKKISKCSVSTSPWRNCCAEQNPLYVPSETLQSHNFVNFWMYIHVFKSLTSNTAAMVEGLLPAGLQRTIIKSKSCYFFGIWGIRQSNEAHTREKGDGQWAGERLLALQSEVTRRTEQYMERCPPHFRNTTEKENWLQKT